MRCGSRRAEVGGVQIQNRGTIAVAISATPLSPWQPTAYARCALILDAEVEIASRCGSVRRLALAEFIAGNRRTALARDEIVTAIVSARAEGDDAARPF